MLEQVSALLLVGDSQGVIAYWSKSVCYRMLEQVNVLLDVGASQCVITCWNKSVCYHMLEQVGDVICWGKLVTSYVGAS